MARQDADDYLESLQSAMKLLREDKEGSDYRTCETYGSLYGMKSL
ncbi:hypothetical protein [Saccharicrinis sp. GN24d3]